MDLKRCNKCGIEKPKTEFYKHSTGKDGLRNECKACFLVKSREKHISLMEDSKGKVPSKPRRTYSEAYYEAHKEEILARQKEYDEAHAKVIAERKISKNQTDLEMRETYHAAHPKIDWVACTVGHHALTGKNIREGILALAESTIICPICKCELKYNGGKTLPESASLDRKHNNHSKNLDDFWIICFLCNVTKLNRNMEAMDSWCLQWQKARQRDSKGFLPRHCENDVTLWN